MTTQPAPQIADLGDVEEYVANAKGAWLQCRSKNHNMLDHDVALGENGTFIVTLRCSRCHTKRDEVIDSQGIILSARYHDHPEGYLLPRGTGRLNSEARGMIRVARLNNALAHKRDLQERAAARAKKAR